MTKVSKEELLKLAKISNLYLADSEIAPLQAQMASVLSYAERVTEIARQVTIPSHKNVNVFRDDVVIKTDSKPILKQAPEREQDLFVVPAILEK